MSPQQIFALYEIDPAEVTDEVNKQVDIDFPFLKEAEDLVNLNK